VAQHGLDGLAGQHGRRHVGGRQRGQAALLLAWRGGVDAVGVRRAEFGRQRAVVHARVLAGARGDLGGQQRSGDAVLVGTPCAAVATQQRGTGAFLAAEAQAAVQQARREPLEADRRLQHRAVQAPGDAVDQGRRHHGLADARVGAPARPVAQQIVHRDGEVVVGRHQPAAGRDDAVAVMVGVAGKGDVETVAQRRQPPHRERRRRVHADVAVPVQRHEGEARVHHVADDGQRQAVVVGDGRPVAHARAAQRVHAHAHAAGADGIEVDDLAERRDVLRLEVVHLGGGRRQRARRVHALHAGQLVLQVVVGRGLDAAGDAAVGRAAVRRVVLEATVARRVVRGRDDDAVGPRTAVAVVRQDGDGHRRRGRELAARRQHHAHAVGGQHLQRAGHGGLGQRVRVGAQVQRPGDAFAPAVVADGLRDGQHMPLIERAVQRRAAVPRGAEHHLLLRAGRIGAA
jgi:hypothetical protein